jgi:3-oxoacyl-[acyl-carrier protein] reductase
MKTVLITGGAGGIGSAAAERFAAMGCNVIINYNKSAEAAIALCERLSGHGGEVLCYGADVSDSGAVREMFHAAKERFGGVDILVNNAGISQSRLFTDISDDDWAKMIGVNLTGVFNCCRAALPYMIRNKSGAIVNVSSIWGETGGSCEVHYSASKAGVIGLTKALAKEVGLSGVRVNCVAPGVIDTAMNDCHSEEAMESLREEIPLGRIGTASEVADVIAYLCSDGAGYITGQVISPNGGMYI